MNSPTFLSNEERVISNWNWNCPPQARPILFRKIISKDFTRFLLAFLDANGKILVAQDPHYPCTRVPRIFRVMERGQSKTASLQNRASPSLDESRPRRYKKNFNFHSLFSLCPRHFVFHSPAKFEFLSLNLVSDRVFRTEFYRVCPVNVSLTNIN